MTPEKSSLTSPRVTIGDVIAILLVLAGVIRVVLLPSAPEQVVQGALLAIATVVWLVFRTVGGRAAAFWRKFGLVLKPTNESVSTVELVIVHDPTGQQSAEEIRARHSVSDLVPTLGLLNTSAAKPEDVLPPQMDNAKGVYFIWTETTHANPVVGRALENWAWKHMEVPILVVNPGNTRHDHLNFRVISQEDAAPAQLLVQEITRTTQWIHLATKLHRWWFYTSAACLIVLIMVAVVSVRFETARRRLAARDYILEPNFTLLASRLFASRQQEDRQPASITLNNDLAELAKFVKDDIAFTTDATSGPSDHISVFRRFETDLQQVDGSALQMHGGAQQPVPLTLNSIAGCAIQTKDFILWEKDCDVGTEAAWDKNGRTIGTCLPKDQIRLNNGQVCSYELGHAELGNRGILCYSPEMASGEISDTVVCLVTPDTNTHFLHSATARAKLRMLSVVANSLPSRMLLTTRSQPLTTQ